MDRHNGPAEEPLCIKPALLCEMASQRSPRGHLFVCVDTKAENCPWGAQKENPGPGRVGGPDVHRQHLGRRGDGEVQLAWVQAPIVARIRPQPQPVAAAFAGCGWSSAPCTRSIKGGRGGDHTIIVLQNIPGRIPGPYSIGTRPWRTRAAGRHPQRPIPPAPPPPSRCPQPLRRRGGGTDLDL